MAEKEKRNTIIFVFPRSGSYDHLIKDPPLSLIYASRLLIKNGFNVELIDQRVEKNWKESLSKALKKSPLYVGISVMTGRPIQFALAISEHVKKNSDVPVVWGGVHPTIEPKTTLENQFVDILIRGTGELCALQLAQALEKGGLHSLQKTEGICFKNDGETIINPAANYSNALLKELPLPSYDLLDYGNYFRFSKENKVFSFLTSYGCPHGCTFCYSPSFSGRKWVPETTEMVMEHFDYVIEHFKPNYISVIDSDFFVNLNRVKELFKIIKEKNWGLTFGFRGVRVDEIKKFDDELYSLMEDIGVKHLHIGAESGSDKVLEIHEKKIHSEDIVNVNRKLADYKSLHPVYNFIAGVPGETYEDLVMTADLVLKILRENPNAQIASITQYTPYPGTKMYQDGITRGFPVPGKLEKWIDFDQEDSAKLCPWVDSKTKSFLGIMTFVANFVDKKMEHYFADSSMKHRCIRLIAMVYRPIAKCRLGRNFVRFPVELWLKALILKM